MTNTFNSSHLTNAIILSPLVYLFGVSHVSSSQSVHLMKMCAALACCRIVDWYGVLLIWITFTKLIIKVCFPKMFYMFSMGLNMHLHSTLTPETIQFGLVFSFPRSYCGIFPCDVIFHAALSLKLPQLASIEKYKSYMSKSIQLGPMPIAN